MIKTLTLALLTFFVCTTASARKFTLVQGAGYAIEPLYGYETVYRASPTPHLATRALYGVRVTAGKDALSAEAEYSKASDTENYQVAPEKVYHEDENYKLGLRSTYRFGQYFFSTGRLDAQATQSMEESTSGGVTTGETKPIRYNPYAGIQLGIRLGVFSLNAGTTAVFRDSSDFTKNDFQHTFSFGVGY